MVDINLRDANPSEIPIIRKHRLKAYQEYQKYSTTLTGKF